MAPDKQFWDEHYQAGTTGWDIGSVSSPLKAYIDQVSDKTKRVLIPGGGNSHEAFYMLQSGFTDITVVDIAPTVVKRLREKGGQNNPHLTVIEQDFFSHTSRYDLILEQTFFCALDPAYRENYARQTHHLLNKGGKLVGVLFNKVFEGGGPPFGGNAEQYETLFTPYFHFLTWAPCYNSIAPRADSEWFMILEKK